MKKVCLGLMLCFTAHVAWGGSSRTITLKNRWISTIAIDDPAKKKTDLLFSHQDTTLTFDTNIIKLRRHILGTYGDYTAKGLQPTAVLTKEVIDNLFGKSNTIIIDHDLTLRAENQKVKKAKGEIIETRKASTAKGKKALLCIDLQRDFLILPIKDPHTGKVLQERGSLAVDGTGQDYIDACEKFIKSKKYLLFLTQDWHPEHHISFASRWWGHEPFTALNIHNFPGISDRIQMLWPDHCVQGTLGAEIVILVRPKDTVVKKGTALNNDSYSGFRDDGGAETELKSLLKAQDITTVIAFGIATDYCVRATVLHALEEEFKAIVITNLCRGVRLPGDTSVIPADSLAAFKDMQEHGAELYFIDSLADGTVHADFLKALKDYGLTVKEIAARLV